MIAELKNTNDSWLKLLSFLRENDHLLPDPLSRHVRLEDYCTKLLDLGRVFIFFEDEEQTVASGLCMGYINDYVNRIAHLQVLIVNCAFQGRGLGEKLVKHFIDQARQSNMKMVELTCDVSNAKARALYKKLGFRESPHIHPNNAKRFLAFHLHD